jgi:hypothetical protein
MARRKIWVEERGTLNVPSSTLVFAELTTSLESRVGNQSLKDYMITRVLGNIILANNVGETSVALGGLAMGITVMTKNIDAVDFPNLVAHEGSWPWYDSRHYTGGGDGLPVLPSEASYIPVDMKSNRKLGNRDRLFLCAALHIATVDTDVHFDLSLLFLEP